MNLPVFLLIPGLLLLLLLLSLRISVEFIAKDTGISYSVRGSVFKFLKLFELKSGVTANKKRSYEEGKETIREKILSMVDNAIKEHRGKIFHIEKLSLKGTFSIEDAAANAILYGLFMILWQFLLIFLSTHFKLEHQNYNFLPDFQHDRNELTFHAILRVVLFNLVVFIIHNLIDERRKKYSKSE